MDSRKSKAYRGIRGGVFLGWILIKNLVRRFSWNHKMSKVAMDVPNKGGFSFDLCKRNAMLAKDGVQLPPFRKTGTTIVGLIFQVQLIWAPLIAIFLPKYSFGLFTRNCLKFIIRFSQDGVILGADTRATEGPIVADKNCEKIHYLAPNIYCCGAGTAADTEAVTGKCLDSCLVMWCLYATV